MRRKLTIKEENSILREVAGLTDKKLIEYYSRLVMEGLGSQAQLMSEKGYDDSDVKEQEDYEDYIQLKINLVESILKERDNLLEKIWKPLEEENEIRRD